MAKRSELPLVTSGSFSVYTVRVINIFFRSLCGFGNNALTHLARLYICSFMHLSIIDCHISGAGELSAVLGFVVSADCYF